MSPASSSRSHPPVTLFFLIALLISACQSTSGEPRTAPATPAPINTAPPAATSSSIPTTETPAPVESPEESDLIEAIQAAADQRSIWQFETEDTAWAVEIVRYECVSVEFNDVDQLAYEELRVTEPNGAVTVVDYQLQYCGGLGAYGLNGLFFSPDGKSFYFDEAREGVPDGAACGYWYKGTSRVDLDTLETERLPGEGPLSSDGARMLLWGRSDFILWDLDAGEIGRVANPIKRYGARSIGFSPDGTQVVVVLREDCIRPEALSAVVLLRLEGMTSEILLEASAPGYIQANWETAGTLLVEDFNGDYFILDLSTGEISAKQ